MPRPAPNLPPECAGKAWHAAARSASGATPQPPWGVTHHAGQLATRPQCPWHGQRARSWPILVCCDPWTLQQPALTPAALLKVQSCAAQGMTVPGMPLLQPAQQRPLTAAAAAAMAATQVRGRLRWFSCLCVHAAVGTGVALSRAWHVPGFMTPRVRPYPGAPICIRLPAPGGRVLEPVRA